MSWFKRRKDKEIDVRVIEMSVAGLARQILHDGLLGDPDEVSKHLDLPPLSEDVYEMEEEASEARIAAISDFLPLLDAHADIMSRICIGTYKSSNSEEFGDASGVEGLSEFFKIISLSSSLTALAMLVDLGLVFTEEIDTYEQ